MCFRTYPEHRADTHQRQNNALGIAALNATLRGGPSAFITFLSMFSARITAHQHAIWA